MSTKTIHIIYNEDDEEEAKELKELLKICVAKKRKPPTQIKYFVKKCIEHAKERKN